MKSQQQAAESEERLFVREVLGQCLLVSLNGVVWLIKLLKDLADMIQGR